MLVRTWVLMATVLGIASCTKPEMREASTAFDLDQVRPFLLRVSRDIERGFDSATVERVYARIAALPLDSTITDDFTVSFDGRQYPLQLIAFMDDVNSPDLALWTPSPLAEHIDSTMQAFLAQNEE